MDDSGLKFKLMIGGMAVVAVLAMLFGMYGLFEEKSSALPVITATPAVTGTPAITPSGTPTTKPGTTPTTTGTPKPGATSTIPGVTPTTAGAKKLVEFTGKDSQTTASFTVSSAPWAVSWSNNPQPGGLLTIYAIDPKNPATPIQVVFPPSTKAEANVVYLQQTGTFTLQITAIYTQWVAQIWTK